MKSSYRWQNLKTFKGLHIYNRDMETQHKRVQDLENELNEYKKRKVNLINELHKVEMCGGSMDTSL